jgi:ADP-ribosylglycohydrolase
MLLDSARMNFDMRGKTPADYDRALAGLLGALIGDAVGVPFEFKSPAFIPLAAQIEMIMPASFQKTYGHIPYGCCSDDGAQLLCLLESLFEHPVFNADHFATQLIRWFRQGHHQSGGSVFDCGIATRHAIERLENGVAPLLAGGLDERSNGNGALMRTLPVAILVNDFSLRIEIALNQSRVTHGHPISQVCCALYVSIARELLNCPGQPLLKLTLEQSELLLSHFKTTGHTEHLAALNLIMRYPDNEFCRGSGYVVDSFWSAINCVASASDYITAVRAAVVLGNDTDTTACIAGGLAGLQVGLDEPIGIPTRWLKQLKLQTESRTLIQRLATALES